MPFCNAAAWFFTSIRSFATGVMPSTAAITPFAFAVNVAPTPAVPFAYVTAGSALEVANLQDWFLYALISKRSRTVAAYKPFGLVPSSFSIALTSVAMSL
jgi:hypothetical protein